MYNVVNFMMKLHGYFKDDRRIPEGPAQVLYKLSESLGKLVEKMKGKGNDLGGVLGDAISRVREGIIGLAECLRNPSRDRDRMDFFMKMIDGMEKIAKKVMEKMMGMDMKDGFLSQVINILTNMKNGNGGPAGWMDGRNGNGYNDRDSLDDLRSRMDDMTKTVKDLMMKMMDNMMKMGDKKDGEKKDISGISGAIGDTIRDALLDDMEEEPCPEPFWKYQISKQEEKMWGHEEHSYFPGSAQKREGRDKKRK